MRTFDRPRGMQVDANRATHSLRRYVPALSWLPAYDRRWFRADVLAGLTAWAVIVPQAVAYAQIAGLPAQAALFATPVALLGYAAFGTSRQLAVSATSATAAVSATAVAPLAGGRAEEYLALSAALRSEEHTSELQSRQYLVCRLLLE